MFLKGSAVAAAAMSFPAIIPATAFGANERIALGCIGVGGMGRGNMRNFLAADSCRVVAVCDVQRDRRERAKKTVDEKYGDAGCVMYGDFRELLARKDIDAVMIAAQDHWHSLIATAAAIKLESDGPVLFKQKRHGFNNEEIEVYKFRSMYADQCDPTAKNAVMKDDPRVTRVGRLIRKTSIDELPQFFNVLFGDLSLVGPRPHAVAAQTRHRLFYEVVDGYFARHRVKPGVTGWAQVNGWRGEIDSDEKIRMRTEFDLYYIENWSLWFDLKILLLTPIRLAASEGAY